MALNTFRGAINGATLPFPLTEKRASTVSSLDRLLGTEYPCPNGITAVLVQANGAVTDPAKKVFKWQDSDAYEVEVVTTTQTDQPCGVAPPVLEDLDADDYFFLFKLTAGARITMIAEGAITAGQYVIISGTTAGSVVDDTTVIQPWGNPSAASAGAGVVGIVTIGSAEETVADTEDVNVLIQQSLAGDTA